MLSIFLILMSNNRYNPIDKEIVDGLIRDRYIYRKVVKKLTQQLLDNNIRPVTDYDKESYNRKERI